MHPSRNYWPACHFQVGVSDMGVCAYPKKPDHVLQKLTMFRFIFAPNAATPFQFMMDWFICTKIAC